MQILRSQVNPIFQSTPSVWRETLSGFHSFQCFTISIHSLRMEGDNCSHRVTLQNVHFNPLPPYGGRPERRCLAMKRFKFQSTPSVWRETFCSSAFRDTLSFQSTPSVWRETDTIIPIYLDGSISIHSLRMEGDEVKTVGYIATNISIHSLRMEGDRSRVSVLLPVMPFQSTPSVWRETRSRLSAISQPIFQSTPSVWRETVQECLSCFQ